MRLVLCPAFPVHGYPVHGFPVHATSVAFASLLLAVALPVLAQEKPPSLETKLRAALQAKTGAVTLPSGIVEISREITLPGDAHDLTIRGSETTIKASAGFRGRALIVIPAGKNIAIRDLLLDGNREAFPQPVAAAQSTAMLSRVFANNGIIAEGVTGLEIGQVKATQVAGFPILVNGGRNVHIHDIEITESGSLDANGRNNGSGGVALEEGVTDFEILHALIGKVRGIGIWIRSADNTIAARGRIADSEFAILARAAVGINHATAVTIENNTGHMFGFPGEETVTTATVLPAAIVSTGAVDHVAIRNNQFEQIAGRCFSLDGFNDGEVTGNQCSATLFNALLIRGTANRITGNHFTDLNNAHRDQPESLRAGVFIAAGASGNIIDSNEISGFGMAQHCIGGSAADNKLTKNVCSDGVAFGTLTSPVHATSVAFISSRH